MPRRRRTKRPRPQPRIQPPLAPQPIFLTLAVEIIEHIVSFLDRPRDLLSLALTSKRTHHIIIPIHLQTRLIQCDIRRTFLWKLLASSPPVIAARFVSLHIIDEPRLVQPLLSMLEWGAILPIFLFDYPMRVDAERCSFMIKETAAMEHLVTAISFMPSLKSFHLESTRTSVTPSLIKALRDSCPDICDLRLHSNSFWIYSDTLHHSLWNFPSLSCFSLNINSHSTFTVNHYRRVVTMLVENCPRLEFLLLSQGHNIATELFRNGRWPNLRTLHITGNSLRSSFNMEIIQSFLDAHSKLESVDIADLVGIFPIAYGPLRNLTLATPYEKIHRRFPQTTLHLEYLCLRGANSIKTRSFFSNLRSLRTLIIRSPPHPSVVMYIKWFLPLLEKLHMRWPFRHQLSCADIESKKGVFQDACDFLRAMTHLTHLSGFAYELSILDGQQTSIVLRRFAESCPTLAFVELRTGSRHSPDRWVAIKRRPDDGTYVRWDSVKSLHGVQIEDWSGHLDPPTPNSNWGDKRALVISKKSRPLARLGRRLNLTHPLNLAHKRTFCRPCPCLMLTLLISLCAAILILKLLYTAPSCTFTYFTPTDRSHMYISAQ